MKKANFVSVSFVILNSLTALAVLAGCSAVRVKPDPNHLKFERSWSRQTVSSKYMGYRQPATVAPVLFNETVVEANGIDGITAFKSKSGHVLWSLPLKNGSEGVLYDKESHGIFLGSNDGQFYHVNADTGAVIWSLPLNSETTSAPTVQGNFIFHLSMNGTLSAFEKDSGRSLWVKSRQPKDPLTIRGNTQPVFEDGKVYAGYSDGYFIAYNAADGSVVWEKKLADNKKFNDVDARPALTSKCILVANFTDSLYCLDKGSGEILWQLTEGGSAQPVQIYNNDVFYSTDKSVLIVDINSGKVKERFNVPKKYGIPTAAIPFESYILFGTSDGPLALVERKSGIWVNEFSPGRGISAAPTVDFEHKEVYIVSNQANIYKLKLVGREGDNLFLWSKSNDN